MAADVLDYEILGEDMQAVVVTLDPGEAAVAESGAMLYMQDGIVMEARLSMKSDGGGGLMGKMLEAGKRALAGDSLFVTFFTNTSQQRRSVAFAAPLPGPVLPVNLHEHGGVLICQKDSFLCAARGVMVDIAFTKRIGAGIFGGEGFILQRISAPDGKGQAFLHAGGTMITMTLAAGEVLRADTGCLVAFEQTVSYEIESVPGIKNKLFSGEGMFNMRFRGPGTLWLQTLPFSRLADRILALSPSSD